MITYRAFMIHDNEGRTIASDLTLNEAMNLLAMLAAHNGISSWTLITQEVEEDCARCAPQAQGHGEDYD